MTHQWNIIDGDIYVSKNGDDVAGDGSMANPYASINKATDVGDGGNKIVIGAGLWQEARGTSTNKYQFIGDGEVLFDYSGSAYFICEPSAPEYFENIGFNTLGIAVFRINSDLYNLPPKDDCHNLYKCRLDMFASHVNGGWGSYNIAANMSDCLIELIRNGYGALSMYLSNCTVKRLYSLGLYRYRINVVFENTVFLEYTLSGYSGSTFTLLGYCLIKDYKSGGYNAESDIIGADPKFNNPDIGDYTLQPTSPCLFAGRNNSTIGAFGLGYSFNANSSEFTKEGGALFSQTTSEDDIVRTQQTINGVSHFLFQMNAGHASGNIESAWIDLQAIRYLLITRIFANLIYNASGVATSRPDNLEAVGEKAIYYDFELKYCNEESEKATAAFKNVIWNKAVTIDNSDRGNADPAFVASEAKYISARFVKIKLYMTEA